MMTPIFGCFFIFKFYFSWHFWNTLAIFVSYKWFSLFFKIYRPLRKCLREISFREKWNIFISVSGQSLVTVYMIQPEVKLIVDVISLRSFWQKWNFMSGNKISCKNYPKWNHMKGTICTCVNKNDWLLFRATPKTIFVSFRPQWKVI